ncbi:hypothetical protein [Eoetvoesiella caeni]
MIKNLLAAVGLVVVIRKGYEFFCHYNELKAENEQFKAKTE